MGKLKGWLKRLSSLLKKTKKSKTASTAAMGLKVTATTLRTPLKTKRRESQSSCPRKTRKRSKRLLRRHLNGLTTTKKQKRRNSKPNKKNLSKSQTQSFKKFIKLELHLKTMKIWMTKTAMNCKFFLAWTNCSHEILGYLVYSQLVKQNAAYWYSHFTQQNEHRFFI